MYRQAQDEAQQSQYAQRSGQGRTPTISINPATDEQRQSSASFDLPTWSQVFFAAVSAIATVFIYRSTARQADTSAQLFMLSQQQTNLMQGQLVATEAAANAANTANIVSRESLAATRRPWVSVVVGVGSRGLYYDVNGANLHLTFILSNTGNNPAAYVQMIGGPSFNIMTNDVMNELEKTCNAARGDPLHEKMLGFTLFPGRVLSSGMVYSFANCDTIKQRQESNKRGVINPFVLGCIDYVSVADKSCRLQSRFVYSLLRVGNEGGSTTINLNDGDIPSGDLKLEQWIEAGSFYAD